MREVDDGWESERAIPFLYLAIYSPKHNSKLPFYEKNHGTVLLLALGGVLLLRDALDDTDSNGLAHITDSETTKRGVFSEGFDTHGLLGDKSDDGSITSLDKLGVGLEFLSRSAIDLLGKLSEFAGNVSSMAIKDGAVTCSNLTRMIQNDDLSRERFTSLCGVVLGVRSDVTTADILNGNVLDIETNVVTRTSFDKSFVMHFDRLHFSGDTRGSKANSHTSLDLASFDTTNGHCSDSTDLVNILKGKTKWLVNGARRLFKRIKSFKKCGTLPPWHIGRALKHVVTNPSRDRDEWNLFGVVSDLLEESGNFVLNFHKAGLTILDRLVVHLVDSDDHLLDTKSEGKKGVFASLTFLGDSGFELTSSRSDNKNGSISLGGTSDHVLDEITMSWGINDGEVVLLGLELPEGDVDGDTTFTLGLQFVQNPGILERTLAHFRSFLLELLDGTLVDATALVNEMTSGGRLARIDMTDNDKINVRLLLSHDDCK
jgi:hypothetical protein